MTDELDTLATIAHSQVGNLRMVRNPKTRKMFIIQPDGRRLPIKASERDFILDNWRRHGGVVMS